MPLIRYKIGDRAVAADPSQACTCGRGLPLIRDVVGRIDSVFEGENGICIPESFFSELFRDYGYLIQQYKVEQAAPQELLIKIKKGSRFSAAEFDKVLALMRTHIGSETGIRIEFVENIGGPAVQRAEDINKSIPAGSNESSLSTSGTSI